MSDDPLLNASTTFNELALEIAAIDVLAGWDEEDLTLPKTFHSLRSFLGARTTAITIRIDQRALWDAEIVLRAASECAIKSNYIFLDQEPKTATALANDFFGELERAFKSRDAARASATANILRKHRDFAGADILQRAADELLENSLALSGRKRREIEKRWGYTALLNKVASRDNKLSADSISSVLHSFGFQSHLIHCNPAAIGLAEDDKARGLEEGILKDRGHASRIYHDLTGYWLTFFLIAEQHFKIAKQQKITIRKLALSLRKELAILQRGFENFVNQH